MRCIQQVNGVARETGNTLCQNNVDFSGFAVGNHPIELFAGFGFGAGYSVVGIYAHIFPDGVALYQTAVKADLCRKGVLQPLGLH